MNTALNTKLTETNEYKQLLLQCVHRYLSRPSLWVFMQDALPHLHFVARHQGVSVGKLTQMDASMTEASI